MNAHVPVLVIGAGPFGLALAAYLDHVGVAYRMHGAPMGFWRDNMPEGMLLRSASDWHLDPVGVDTIEAYLDTRSLAPADVEPLSLAFYLDYADWFQERKGLRADPRLVQRLDAADGGGYAALLDDGDVVTADSVVVAVGFRYFQHVPDEVCQMLPPGRFTHTCELVDMGTLRGQRCVILGGRQSAFEWAALLHEAGAASVDVCHRHASPSFTEADWSWVNPLVDDMVSDPGWFRLLSQAGREEVERRLWAEGRLKVEPWLRERLAAERVRIRPNTKVSRCVERSSGDLELHLDSGDVLVVDHVVLATGYKPDVSRVPFLAAGNLLGRIATEAGHAPLDTAFQTNLPGLYLTSMLAVRDFGPFFAFTISTRTSARLIGDALAGALLTAAKPARDQHVST